MIFNLSFFQVHAVEGLKEKMLDDYNSIKNSLNLSMVLQTPESDYQKIMQQILDFEKIFATDLKKNTILQKNIKKLKKVTDLQKKLSACLKDFNSDSSIGKKIISSLSQNVELFEDSIINCSLKHSSNTDIKQVTSKADQDERKNILNEYINKVKSNAQMNIQKMNISVADSEDAVKSAVAKVNENIERLNALNELPLTGSAQKDREKMAAEKLNLIQSTFWQLSSSGEGLLMHMPAIKNKMGDIESKASVKYSGGTRAQGPIAYLNQDPLKAKINFEDVQTAKKEYNGQMQEVIKEMTTKAAFKDKDVNNYLIELVQTQPLMAGQMLLDNPARVDIFCDLFNKVDQQNKSEGTTKKVRNIGFMIVGGTLAVVGTVMTFTGAGAVAGIPLTYSGMAVAAAGATVTAAEVGFSYADYREAQSGLNQMVQATLANSGTGSSFYQKAYFEKKAEASSAAKDVALSLGTSAIGGIGFLKGVSKFRQFSKLDEVQKFETLFPKQVSVYSNLVGDARYGELMGSISILDKAVQKNLLELLAQRAQQSPDEAKKLFAQIEEIVSKQCKR